MKRALAQILIDWYGKYETSLSKDEALDLISNRRRRLALKELNNANGPMELDDLAYRIAAIENDLDIPSSQQKKNAYVGLYQAHIPKLEGAGVVEFERGTVIPTETEPLLAIINAIDSMFYEY